MPRYVEHDERRRDIVRAATKVVARQGLQGFSIRAVAEELGGSVTLVTHYYPSRQAILDDLATTLIEWWSEDVAAMEVGLTSGSDRLKRLLEWLAPLTEEGLEGEWVRIHLLAGRAAEPMSTNHLFEAWENYVRTLLRSHVDKLVPAERVGPTVDMLRVVTNGLVLSAIEHPEIWSPERMRSVLEAVVDQLHLSDA